MENQCGACGTPSLWMRVPTDDQTWSEVCHTTQGNGGARLHPQMDPKPHPNGTENEQCKYQFMSLAKWLFVYYFVY